MTLLYFTDPTYLARVDGQLVHLSEQEASERYSPEQIQKARDLAWANERVCVPVYDGRYYHIRHLVQTRKDAIEAMRDLGMTRKEAEHILACARLLNNLGSR